MPARGFQTGTELPRPPTVTTAFRSKPYTTDFDDSDTMMNRVFVVKANLPMIADGFPVVISEPVAPQPADQYSVRAQLLIDTAKTLLSNMTKPD